MANLNSAEKAKIFTSFSHYFSVQIAQWNTEDKLTIDEKIEAKAFLFRFNKRMTERIFDQKAELKKQVIFKQEKLTKDEENLKRSSLDSFFISKEEKQMKKEQNDFLQKKKKKKKKKKKNFSKKKKKKKKKKK